jgi:hypothetical protein
MARPKVSNGRKHKKMSISVNSFVANLAERADRTSHFFQTSVECCEAIRKTVRELERKRISSQAALKHIGRVLSVWEAEFDAGSSLSEVEAALKLGTTKGDKLKEEIQPT